MSLIYEFEDKDIPKDCENKLNMMCGIYTSENGVYRFEYDHINKVMIKTSFLKKIEEINPTIKEVDISVIVECLTDKFTDDIYKNTLIYLFQNYASDMFYCRTFKVLLLKSGDKIVVKDRRK